MVQWLAHLPGTQENRGSSPGRGMTDFLYVNIQLFIYIYKKLEILQQVTF